MPPFSRPDPPRGRRWLRPIVYAAAVLGAAWIIFRVESGPQAAGRSAALKASDQLRDFTVHEPGQGRPEFLRRSDPLVTEPTMLLLPRFDLNAIQVGTAADVPEDCAHPPSTVHCLALRSSTGELLVLWIARSASDEPMLVGYCLTRGSDLPTATTRTPTS
ncbi:MAG: hypothetical protein O2819_06190 [Planctomycetota bacterium]|nr:hypothetical protein [Planctomycetota bacterium]MDA1105166.1 hypothetical protein [Planctomycetota bacterium]